MNEFLWFNITKCDMFKDIFLEKVLMRAVLRLIRKEPAIISCSCNWNYKTKGQKMEL